MLAAGLLGPVDLGELHRGAALVGDRRLPRVAEVGAPGQVQVVDVLLAAEVV